MPNASSPARTRLQLSLLGLLFFAPFFGAYVAVFVFDWRPGGGRLNYGELVNPARPTPEIRLRDAAGQTLDGNPLRDKWTLVQLLKGGCDEDCRRELVLSRQTRTTFNDRRERVQRLVIADEGTDLAALQAELSAEHPDLIWTRDASAGERAHEFFAEVPSNALLLLDPRGNWLMWYPPVAPEQDAIQRDFKGMQKDINKLLRLSSMG